MPYFPVDDQFAFHPKALMAGNAAIGVWTRAGAWCKNHVSGGHVPHGVASALGTPAEVKRLVTAGLWVPVDGGYRFHDWEHQAGNGEGDEEKLRRDALREKDRLRKAAQRERDRAGSHADSHADNTPDSDADMARIPDGFRGPPVPVPVPLTGHTHIGPVPEANVTDGSDELESIESLCARQAASMGVDFGKVKTEVGKACGRFPDPTGVMRIIATILDRATPPVNSPTGLVVTAIRSDWAEWQKLLDEAVA